MKIMAPLAVLCLPVVLALMVAGAGRVEPPARILPAVDTADSSAVQSAVRDLNTALRTHWQNSGVAPVGRTSDLTVLRRMSLALVGTPPSLEEIRAFEADTQPDRLDRSAAAYLKDPRCHEYLAERLARSLVGVEEGTFVLFRRDRFVSWLTQQLANDRPWDEMVRAMISAEGRWTDRPAVNFITAGHIADEGIDENKLAGRTVRAFLGQRMDCAQCHDHPFVEDWKQHHFEGLAAYFGQARITPGGVADFRQEEGDPLEYTIQLTESDEPRVVPPAVPFHDEWLPAEKITHRRQRLAHWVTHSDNQRFERTIANRMWGILFGTPWSEPVDDLPNPPETADVLDTIGRHWRQNGGRLSLLIRTILHSEAFRLESAVPEELSDDDYYAKKMSWAVFPLVRLRPEQVIGSMFQAAHIRTIDQKSHLFVRIQRFGNETDFLKEYGDLGEEELGPSSGTIPQSLLRMNGRFTRELTEAQPFSGAGQLLNFSESDEELIHNCFLTCLTRRPSSEEKAYFLNWLQERDKDQQSTPPAASAGADDTAPDVPRRSRKQAVRDLFWVLFNSPEFSWNH